MKLKVCGMRTKENIESLLALKPDFIGFIFYDKSKRFVADFPQIKVPSETKKVGVFVNEDEDVIFDKVNEYQLDLVQLHGDESPEFCKKLKSLGVPKIIKAFSVDEHFNFESTVAYENGCNYFLFDAKGKNYGGNGVKFNWEILNKYKGKIPFLLSGGISKNDVDDIKKIHHSALKGIDINSGFELKPGLKNIEEIKKFKNSLV